MTAHMPLNQATLEQLAPQQLLARRENRYLGEGYGVSIDTFVDVDQATLRNVYATLLDLYDFLQERKHAPLNVPEIVEWIERQAWQKRIHELQQLGVQTKEENESELLRQVIHDVRGGSLAALSMTLQLMPMGLSEHHDFIHMFFLTRDHLKIMRNAIPDLDPELTARDRTENEHSIELIVEKWQNTIYNLSEHQAQVELDAHFTGNISERCMEFSALDRVVYNLINNAVRFTANNRVYFAIFGLEDTETPDNVRFVVYNPITEQHKQTVQEAFGNNINRVFGTDFTTGGSGMGMAICAGFVSNAYGLNSIERALTDGYCGATIIDDMFVTWFHWPVVAD